MLFRSVYVDVADVPGLTAYLCSCELVHVDVADVPGLAAYLCARELVHVDVDDVPGLTAYLCTRELVHHVYLVNICCKGRVERKLVRKSKIGS